MQGLAGPGAGKSTLLKAILGLIHLAEIRIDGVPTRKALSRIAYVEQKPY